ncbi:MAG: sigma-70 family RNA polymerase sigma factor [Pyrinomonadaceae bacterium]|nr:sigma-70 family RNA polymerase sigma factor [Sphingobacteriaceae bacterium]
MQYWNQMIHNNDMKAFEALFYALNSRLIKFSLLYFPRKEVAEEIVSDVFVNCWLNRSTLGHINSPETYLFVAVKHKAINQSKATARLKLISIDENNEILVETYQPDKAFEKKELMHKLDKAIESLPLQCKIIFKLVKEDGMKCKKVAEILEISPRTVETQLYRAMHKLSYIMTDYQKIRHKGKIVNINKASSIIIALIQTIQLFTHTTFFQ